MRCKKTNLDSWESIMCWVQALALVYPQLWVGVNKVVFAYIKYRMGRDGTLGEVVHFQN
jgi:hypothetical protein